MTDRPYSLIAYLDFPPFGPQAPGTDDPDCTGFFINSRMLLTAAHCIADADPNQTEVNVYPRRTGNNVDGGVFHSTNLLFSGCYDEDANVKACDYGAVILDRPAVGHPFEVQILSNAALQGLQVNITGYPGDKPYGTMWTMEGPIDPVTATNLRYAIDTFGGQSGSPVWYEKSPGVFSVVGIHVAGNSKYCGLLDPPKNCATPLTAAVMAEVNGWKESKPVPVGGLSLDPDVDAAPLETESSSDDSMGVLVGSAAGGAVLAIVVGSAAWYGWRRRVR